MMKIQIWSDVVCPFCYIGKKNFEAALQKFEHRDQVQVEWKSFELDPKAVKNSQPGLAKGLAQKYKKSLDEAQTMIDQMTLTAKRAGIAFNLAQAIPTNSFEAHRLIHLAAKYGKQDAAEERLFSAYMIRGEDIANLGTLIRIGNELGLPEAEVQSLVNTGDFAEAVRQDENEAFMLKVRGVPYFLIAKKFAISGAQPVEHFSKALQQAWDSTRTKK